MPTRQPWLERFNAKVLRKGGQNALQTPTAPASSVSTDSTPQASFADREGIRLEATRDERLRIKSIMGSREALGREQTASELAFETSLPATKARELLAGMQLDADLAVDAIARQIACQSRRPAPDPAR